jgi:hypothetical protein
MTEERKSPTEDRDILEHYLVWRERDRQQRRQRRVRQAVVIAGLVSVVGFAAAGWLSYRAHLRTSLRVTGSPAADIARAPNVVDTTRVDGAPAGVLDAKPDVVDPKPRLAPSPPAPSAPPSSPQIARTPAPPTPPTAPVRRTARADVPAPVRIPAPERVRAEPPRESAPSHPPALNRATTSDLEASAAPPDDWPPAITEEHGAAEPHDAAATPRVVIVPWTSPSSTPVTGSPRVTQNPVAIPADSSPATTPARPKCPDFDELVDGSSPDGRTRGKRVADCVGGWVKAETREFRDGVKRGVDEFRGGIDKVGRGLQWLGDKLRRPE